MGYRFTLESAHTVANLTFGKVLACFREIHSSEENFWGFRAFLDQFNKNMFSNENERYYKHIHRLRDLLDGKNSKYYRNKEHWEFYENEIYRYRELRPYDEKVLEALKGLSDTFSRCKLKSLLLPRIDEGNSLSKRWYVNDDFMLHTEMLHDLLEYHPGDSCLILQPTERPRAITIFDTFPNFEIAIRERDIWPAVIFWDGSGDYAFIPVEEKGDLRHLFKIIHYDNLSIRELKNIAQHNKRPSHYILHLSDLHFGAKNVDVTERRLKKLIQKQVASLHDKDNLDFIITGDISDSPDQKNANSYRNFSEDIEERYGKKPTCVLGNHDINRKGLAFWRGKQHLANIVGNYPKIKILEESKAILLLFNSNTKGKIAQGEIGSAQMSEMGNLLDGIENVEKYLLIAVMHHHLIPIMRPEHYDDRWYRRIIPSGVLDATLRLNDADVFMEWLKRRNVRFVLHGHKHIPFHAEHEGVQIISCGSSTGQIVHKERGKTYISYNLIKISEDTVTCTLFVEDILGAGAVDIKAPPPIE